MDGRVQTAPSGNPRKQRKNRKGNASSLRPATTGSAFRSQKGHHGFSSTSDLAEISQLPRSQSELSVRIVDTRHGRRRGNNTVIGSEERFAWQKPSYLSDAIYDIPTTIHNPKATRFGSSTRDDWKSLTENKKDNVNPYTGPGRYRTLDERKTLSSAPDIKMTRFGSARREFGDLKTLSPGPAYNIDGAYRFGKDKKISPGFNKDNRKPPEADLLKSTCSTHYMPKMPKGGPSCSFPKDQGYRERDLNAHRSPGPIYDTTRHDFKTGPSFSFGASKAKRF